MVRRITSGGLLDKLKSIAKPGQMNMKTRATSAEIAVKGAGSSDVAMRGETTTDPRNLLKMSIHRELIQAMDLRKGETDTKGKS